MAKMSIKEFSLLAVVGVACVIVGFALAAALNLTPPVSGQVDEETIKTLDQLSAAYEHVAKVVSPAVVNITTTVTTSPQSFNSPFGGGGGPQGFQFFGPFGDFFNQPPQQYQMHGEGSGVIVSSDGIILTNNHVIADATQINVRLLDDREFTAKVIGTDPKTDIAVIKIDGEDLPVAVLGDSDQVQVGEIVLAIGHPFSLVNTVTQGIISAKGRSNVGLAEYEDFFQTDAAINPGNSGGPLINLRGEVIGINTAIATSTGQYAGVGFAIPINMCKDIMEQLLSEGKVTRGWLGVYIQPVTKDLQKQFNLDTSDGALVSEVTADGPAEKAGIKSGDIITQFNGQKVKGVNELRTMVAAAEVGSEVTLTVIRDGATKEINVVLGELPENLPSSKQEQLPSEQTLGMVLQELTPEIAKQLGYEGESGLVVGDVVPGSPADNAGIQRGDLIVEVGRRRVATLDDFRKAMSYVPQGEGVLLLVKSGDHAHYVVVTP